MTRSQFSELRVQEMTRSMGVYAPRTSRDVCRDAVAIECPEVPSRQGLVYIACAIGAVAVALSLWLT